MMQVSKRFGRNEIKEVVMKRIVSLALAVCMVMALSLGAANAAAGKKTVTIWRGQGTDHEEALYNREIAEFNAQSETTVVEYEVFPYNDFGTTVRAAIATNSLPEMIYVDGTEIGNLAFMEAIVPLNDYIGEEFTQQYAQSAIYAIDGKIYGVAQQDGGLAFWANKEYLDKAGVRIATYEEPWSKEEFVDALAKLKALEEVEFPLDMKTNWGGGYVIYAWQPLVVSMGADWYNHETMRATGALNGPAMVEAMAFIKDMVDKGYVDPNQTVDSNFVDGAAALDLTGHWNFNDYSAALGDKLVLVPLPDFGNGSHTGIGGLPFAVTTTALANGTVENCAEFIKFALGESFQMEINDVNGSMPVLKAALETTEALKEGGPLYLYAQQLVGGKYAVRPMSAAFPTYQADVGTAAFDILAGADIQETLDRAAASIDKVIEENGY
jgi:multiple sugar transport system substrate-binding protein